MTTLPTNLYMISHLSTASKATVFSTPSYFDSVAQALDDSMNLDQLLSVKFVIFDLLSQHADSRQPCFYPWVQEFTCNIYKFSAFMYRRAFGIFCEFDIFCVNNGNISQYSAWIESN